MRPSASAGRRCPWRLRSRVRGPRGGPDGPRPRGSSARRRGRAGAEAPRAPVPRAHPRPSGRPRPSARASAAAGGAACGTGAGGTICPFGTLVRSSSRRRIIGPLLRRSLGGPTLIRSLAWGLGWACAGGGVGAGIGRGRTPGGSFGASCRSTAAGGRNTKSFRSRVLRIDLIRLARLQGVGDQHHEEGQVEDRRDEKTLSLVESAHAAPLGATLLRGLRLARPRAMDQVIHTRCCTWRRLRPRRVGTVGRGAEGGVGGGPAFFGAFEKERTERNGQRERTRKRTGPSGPAQDSRAGPEGAGPEGASAIRAEYGVRQGEGPAAVATRHDRT